MLKSAMLMMGGKQEDHVLRIQGNVDMMLSDGVVTIQFSRVDQEIEIPFSQLNKAANYQVVVIPNAIYSVVMDNLVVVPPSRPYGPVVDCYRIENWNKDAYVALIPPS